MSSQPASLPLPERLLNELQTIMPMLELHATDGASVWQLHLGSHSIRLRWLDNPARIELALAIGELPDDAPAALYQALLAYNGVAGLNRSMRVASEGPIHALHLLCDQPAGACSAADLKAALLDLTDAAQSVQIWLHVQLDGELATADEILAIH